MSSLLKSYYRVAPLGRSAYSQPATDNGSPTGNRDMNVDGSSTPVDFWAQPEVDEILFIQQINVLISDAGNPNINDYGSITGPLANGTIFFVEQNGVRTFVSVPFKQNDSYIRASRTFDFLTFAGGTRVLAYREFFNEFSNGILLNGATNDKFGLVVQDNLTTLNTHECQIKGYTQKIIEGA